MKNSSLLQCGSLSLFIVLSICLGSIQAKALTTYTLATGSKGGTYYPVGEAISILSKTQLQPIKDIHIASIASAGSGANIKLLHENKAQFAIVQGLYGYYAWNGVGPLKADGKQKDLRSITMLWKNVEHFIITSDKKQTGLITDLAGMKGATLALGKLNSGTLGSSGKILGNLGLDISNDFKLLHEGYAGSANALKANKISGMAAPSGFPAAAVTYCFRTMGDKLTILDFTEEQAKNADGGLGLWSPCTIPAGTYPGQDKDVHTIAQPNFLAVHADVDEEAVYLLTKLLYKNLNFLRNIHGAVKEMSTDNALNGLPVPLHPGAIRYFKEIGLSIPENLIAK